jgi:predicted Rossmann fold flavoprotein
MKVIIIGGGAAGFFGAITLARHNADAEIIIIEKTQKLLSKVKVSGGGRCNVTNSEQHISQLLKNYPRGNKELRSVFNQFSTKDTFEFFEDLGVKLKVEKDGRVFPTTDSSQTIIDCLLKEARKLKIKILTGVAVKSIQKIKEGFELELQNQDNIFCDRLLVATGGTPKIDSYEWLQKLNQDIVTPVPSLFTFNTPENKLIGLQGLAVNNAIVKIQGHKQTQEGPVLITHWGLSGPGVLKLSAWFARQLNEANYQFHVVVNWLPEYSEETLRQKLSLVKIEESGKKVINSAYIFTIPKRLWERFVELADIGSEVRWADISKKQLNVLIQELVNATYYVNGKTTFKEEFVTAGGVNMAHIDLGTMESKIVSRLYFAGEVLDIDGITGGFNFQAAWSTGFVAGKNMAIV